MHETLSQGPGETVDFDDVVARTSCARGGVVRRVGAGGGRTGTAAFGELRGENATPLALVLTELVTNAVEHGLRRRGGVVDDHAPSGR